MHMHLVHILVASLALAACTQPGNAAARRHANEWPANVPNVSGLPSYRPFIMGSPAVNLF